MHAEIVDNVSRDMVSVLLPTIAESSDIRMAVAFASRRGLALIEPSIKATLLAGGYLEFLVGLDMQTTEPNALQFLYDLSCQNSNVALYCFASLSPASIYHPKVYLMRNADAVKSVVGSSNLTEGGLKKNIEANVVLDGHTTDEVISDLYATYSRLKFHPKRVVPDEEFLKLYAELCMQRQQTKSASDKSSHKTIAAFDEKTKTLRRPIPGRRDLVGWLELVYDSLPDGEFTNQQAYSYEQEFQRHYPTNLNIRAKIRQQLQMLQKMGLMEHIGTGHWRKL